MIVLRPEQLLLMRLGRPVVPANDIGGDPPATPTKTEVQQNSLPEYVRPYYEPLLGQAQALTDINANPYQSYRGQRVADFSPMQQQAFTQLQGMQLPGQTAQATQMATNAGAGAQGIGSLALGYQGYQPGQFSAQTVNPSQVYGSQVGTDRFIDPNVAASYMSPFIQNALNPVMTQMQRMSDLRQRDLGGKAQQAGAFGGSRFALQQAEEQRNTERAKGDTYASGLANAYNAAQQAYATDSSRALQAALANQGNSLQAQQLNQASGLQAALANQGANLQTQQMGEQSRQFGQSQGLQALNTALGANQQGLAAANTVGQMGQQQYAQELGLNQAQQLAGAQQQNLQQQNLTNQYNEFLNRQNWPYRNISFMADVIGRPMQQTSSSIYQAPPTTTQSLLGLGLGAYGLSGMLGGSGGKKAGGPVKRYAAGGVSQLNDQQLAQQTQQPSFSGLLAMDEAQKRRMLRTAAPAQPDATLPPAPGLAALPAPNMAFTDGGIVGYEKGGRVARLSSSGAPMPEESPQPSAFSKWLDSFVDTPLGYGITRGVENVGGTFRGMGNFAADTLTAPYKDLYRLVERGLSPMATYDPKAPAQAKLPPNIWTNDEPAVDMPAGAAPASAPSTSPAVAPKRATGIASAVSPRMPAAQAPALMAPERAALNADTEFAKLQGLEEMAREKNPLHAGLSELAGKYARERENDPYAAAVNAAGAIMNARPGVRGLAGLAYYGGTGAAAAGQGQLARDKEHLGRQEKLFTMEAALRDGDLKQAGRVYDSMSRNDKERMELSSKEYLGQLSAQAHAHSADMHYRAAVDAARIRLQGAMSGAGSANDARYSMQLVQASKGLNTLAQKLYEARLRDAPKDVLAALNNPASRAPLQKQLWEQSVADARTQYLPTMNLIGKQLRLGDDEMKVLLNPPPGMGDFGAPMKRAMPPELASAD